MSRDDNRTAALKLVPVSRETLERLDAYVALLGQWRKAVNLISESTFAEVWTRHVADSAQLLAFAPQAKIWVDMGSGAGFPGLVIAIQLANQPGALVHLIESDKRKCAFLREAARVAGAPAIIHNERIETAAQRITDAVDAVSARALAPLPKLIDFAKIWLEHGAIGVFPRGRTDEPVVRSDFRNYTIEFPRSRTDTMSSISIIRKQPPEKIVAATSPDGLAEP
jgi:16S rRNA (guanine527-N7)-methyltransferase